MRVELENFDTSLFWYHDLAEGGDNFKIAFNIYLYTHPERVDAIQKYLAGPLKEKEDGLKIFKKEYIKLPDDLFILENYIKYLLEYRRFRIMTDLAFNANPPNFKPLEKDDLVIVDLLINDPDAFNPFKSSRLRKAQYAEILKQLSKPEEPPPSNTNRPPRGRGRGSRSVRYSYTYL
jgi:hypothetical protein